MLSTSGAIAFFAFITLAVLFLSALVSMGFNSLFKRDIQYRVVATSITVLFAFLVTFFGVAFSLGPLSRLLYGPTTEVSMDAVNLLFVLSTAAGFLAMLAWQIGLYRQQKTNS